jgi:hypothetical protein
MDDIPAAWLYPIILIAGAVHAWGPPMNNALSVGRMAGAVLMVGGTALIPHF